MTERRPFDEEETLYERLRGLSDDVFAELRYRLGGRGVDVAHIATRDAVPAQAQALLALCRDRPGGFDLIRELLDAPQRTAGAAVAHQALDGLLLSLFPDGRGLRRHLCLFDPRLASHLPEGGTPAALSRAAVGLLASRGQLDAVFFASLAEVAPARADEVGGVASHFAPAFSKTPTSPALERARGREVTLRAARRQRLLDEGNDADVSDLDAKLEAIASVIERLRQEAALRSMRPARASDVPFTAGSVLLGRYELVEAVGRGGFARVWKAWDRETEQVVAVKALRSDLVGEQERVRRFIKGAEAMAALDHPRIVRLVGQPGVVAGRPFFVMEFLPGGDLHQALTGGRLDAAGALQCILQVGEALAYAHGAKHLHRDVKPQNILLDAGGCAKLADFDLVRTLDSTGGTKTGSLGTFLYAAPEMMPGRRETPDSRVDVYGLGMTALCVLCKGTLPADIVYERAEFFEDWAQPAALKRVLKKAISVRRGRRYDSVTAFCAALAAVSETAVGPAKSSPEPVAPELPAPPARAGAPVIDEVTAPPVLAMQPATSPAPRRGAAPEAGTLRAGALGLRWRYIPAGQFWMGSPEGVGYDDEHPQHEVRLSRGFWMLEEPVTQGLYERVVGENPSRFKGDPRRPVERVSWFEAIDFCNALTEALRAAQPALTPAYTREGDVVRWTAGAGGVRLPTEAEWEYACRAGTPTAYWSGDEERDLARVGWYSGNSRGEDGRHATHPVGEKAANPWGLYDVHGKVREWCWDWFGAYTKSAQTDPQGPPSGTSRVLRGGSWDGAADWCRSAFRSNGQPGVRSSVVGFRVVCSSAPAEP